MYEAEVSESQDSGMEEKKDARGSGISTKPEVQQQEMGRGPPGYWKEYRKRNPEKAERNRILQAIRNRHRSKKMKVNARGDPLLIAKVDSLERLEKIW